ncbi:MAG TPA: hypothetical protein VF753_16440 [Terriglobales bacterium]
MTPDSIAKALSEFLRCAQDAVIVEDGAAVFDLRESKYSISGERNKCLLHVWSAERNAVRRVLDLELKNDVLRLSVQRMGQTKPTKLEICRERDRRTPSAKRMARLAYSRVLGRVLMKQFPGWKATALSTAIDLERSFGPVYSRGLLCQGQRGFAVLGVNAEETQASIDGSLTFGIVWLDSCRTAQAGKMVVEGLKLFLPAGKSAVVRERIAYLDRFAAKWHLYEVDGREEHAKEIDIADCGNVATRLVRVTDEMATRDRFGSEIAIVHELMPEAEIAILSPAEIAFRCHGLEFARARLAQNPASFRMPAELVFGLGVEEKIYDQETATLFELLVRGIGEVRHNEGPRDHPLWRMHPERWLESLVVKNVNALDERLEASSVYSQVPAFSASDRAMIDVLAITREGRLAVIELKADEDIHLPLQALDYWSRVAWHHARGEFKKFGYFSDHELSDEKPWLVLVAPALRVHPATDTLLRYISPRVVWMLAGIDERWRDQVRVVFRKRSTVETEAQRYEVPSLLRTGS